MFRNWSGIGCVEPTWNGQSFTSLIFSVPAPLSITLSSASVCEHWHCSNSDSLLLDIVFWLLAYALSWFIIFSFIKSSTWILLSLVLFLRVLASFVRDKRLFRVSDLVGLISSPPLVREPYEFNLAKSARCCKFSPWWSYSQFLLLHAYELILCSFSFFNNSNFSFLLFLCSWSNDSWNKIPKSYFNLS